MPSYKNIKRNALELLQKNHICQAPVEVEAVAQSLGIEVRKTPSDDDISGFLFKHPTGAAVIGVNISHHPNRQRFTIAHEIGHFVLHDYAEVHVDRFMVKLRNQESSTGDNREEVEANRFAAELLMPEEFLVADLPRFALNDLLDDRGMQQLAKKYQVSVQAMTNRLISLNYIPDQLGRRD